MSECLNKRRESGSFTSTSSIATPHHRPRRMNLKLQVIKLIGTENLQVFELLSYSSLLSLHILSCESKINCGYVPNVKHYVYIAHISVELIHK